MAATTSCNATPAAHKRSAYIWFGKFKRWPQLWFATPRHLHNIGQHIFGLENFKDGRNYDLQRNATCATLVNIYLVWKILKMAAATSCNAMPPAQAGRYLVWMRSSRVVRSSDSQCRRSNCPGFDPSILRHSEIWGAADETVLNIVHIKNYFVGNKRWPPLPLATTPHSITMLLTTRLKSNTCLNLFFVHSKIGCHYSLQYHALWVAIWHFFLNGCQHVFCTKLGLFDMEKFYKNNPIWYPAHISIRRTCEMGKILSSTTVFFW